jgi:hypothetical protein
VAVSRGKKVNGQWEDVTTWHDVTCFNDLAENAAASLKVGDEIIAEGYVEEPRIYQKKDNTTAASLPFVANALGMSLRWAVASSGPGAQRKTVAPKVDHSEEPF